MYNVLLVDDEPRTINALEKNIDWRKCGVRKVFKARGMAEAIEYVNREKIEIMICDIEMPGGNGIQLLEWFRNNHKQINCIFLTCHPEFDYMRKAIQLRCYDYILKPIHYEEFVRVLSDLIGKMELSDNGIEMTAAKDWDKNNPEALWKSSYEKRDVELEIKKYIREHLVDNITVTDIAEAFHFNPQYLMRIFKKKSGMSIVEYITKTRLEMAQKILLETNLPIQEIANMVGYSDYAYFTRVFKKETGCSPRRFRMDKNNG